MSKKLLVTVNDTVINSLRTAFGKDPERWAEFLSNYINANEDDIDLAANPDEPEPEWNGADAAWPIFF